MSRPILLDPGEGEPKTAFGIPFAIKARGADTGGAFLAFEFMIEPGGGVPPHFHRNEDETLYVLQGEIETVLGDEQTSAVAGSFQFIPKGTVHAQSNPGNAPAKLLLLFSPPTFEGFLDEADGASEEETMALMAKYGMEMVE